MYLAKRNNYDLFDEMFRDPFFMARPESKLMKTDIIERDSAYELQMELPGFSKEEITAELKEGYLTIKAEKSEQTQDNEETEEGVRYLHRERSYGSCSRTMFVGKEVREEDIRAAFKDGVLTVIVPKKAPEEPQTRSITIA